MAFFDDQTELIRALFADSVASGVAEHSWAGLLRRLAEVTQADGAALSVHKMSDELGHWRHGDAGGISLQLRQKMRTDRVYDGETLPAVDLKPGYVRALKVRVEMSTHACLWVWRGMHRKDFRSVDGGLLGALGPYLGQAVGASLELRKERWREAVACEMMEGLGAGWIAFDRFGGVAEYSKDIGRILNAAGVRLVDGRLAFEHLDDAQGLRAAVLAAAAKRGSGVLAVLSREPLVEMVLRHVEREGERGVIGMLRTTPLATVKRPEEIAAHLKLSRSEARLAALLVDGMTLKSAAVQLGWTEETTRSASKKIFARMDVSGQPELIRRVHGGSLWFRVN